MEIQDFFYITASVAFILISILVLVIFFFGWFLKKTVRKTSRDFETFAKSWGAVTLSALIIKLFRNLFFNKKG